MCEELWIRDFSIHVFYILWAWFMAFLEPISDNNTALDFNQSYSSLLLLPIQLVLLVLECGCYCREHAMVVTNELRILCIWF